MLYIYIYITVHVFAKDGTDLTIIKVAGSTFFIFYEFLQVQAIITYNRPESIE